MLKSLKQRLIKLLSKRNKAIVLESYLEAKNKFLSGDFVGAEIFFAQNNFVLEYGYCKLLSGDFAGAKAIFSTIASTDLRADWAGKLIQFVEGYVAFPPSFFQIRNFLEIDLNLLIQAKRPEYVENIINGADIFYSINPESYKFIARVMMFNDYLSIAVHYLMKAKDKFYYDPEMHFMLAQCYMKTGEIVLAKQSIKACLSILPNYIPAVVLKDKLNLL